MDSFMRPFCTPFMWQGLVAGSIVVYLALAVVVHFTLLAEHYVTLNSLSVSVKYYLWYYVISSPTELGMPSSLSGHLSYDSNSVVVSRVFLLTAIGFATLALLLHGITMVIECRPPTTLVGGQPTSIPKSSRLIFIVAALCLLLATCLTVGMVVTFVVYYSTTNSTYYVGGLIITATSSWGIGLRIALAAVIVCGWCVCILALSRNVIVQSIINAGHDDGPSPVTHGQPLEYHPGQEQEQEQQQYSGVPYPTGYYPGNPQPYTNAPPQPSYPTPPNQYCSGNAAPNYMQAPAGPHPTTNTTTYTY